ncbi:MAG: pitrilysin family protein [Verrucomicrobiota bacterium]|nr:pitrilysin family protein [Verrucomicrobiota bacterium]
MQAFTDNRQASPFPTMDQKKSYSMTTTSSGAQLCHLPNGLTLILLQDKSAPVVSVQAWCQAGSVHEGQWLGAGLSHVLEHMLFKGTTTRGKGRIDQEVQEAGGYMNAYTSFDRTVYYVNVPSAGAKVAIDILCDIMQNATLPEDELASELEVIRREMDMNHDDPARRSGRGLFETAYLHSPYRYTVIGYPDVFNRIKRANVFDYYRQMYTPSNQFFVVVGDIHPEHVIEQVSEAYSGASFSPLPPILIPDEPPQSSPRQRIEEASIELGHAHFSWHIPGIGHQDLPALETLSILLGGGRSSRLYRRLREELGLVHGIDAWTYNPGKPGIIGISGVFDGEKYEAVAKAVTDEIRRIQEEGILESELQKAIKQLRASNLATRKTMQGQAQELGGAWMAARDLEFSNRYLEKVEALTPGTLKQVSQKYLDKNTCTSYALLPHGARPTPSKVCSASTKSNIEKWEVGNGMRVLLKQDNRLPFVEMRSVFFGGTLTEEPQNNGITQLMAQGLLKGTNQRDAANLMESVESIGGSIESYAGNNSFGVNIEVLSQDKAFGLDLMQEILRASRFPEGEIDRERQVQLAGIRAQKDQLLSRCFKLMRRGLFGKKGYGLNPSGEESSVESLSIEAIRTHSQNLITPGNQVICVFGDINIEETKDRLSRFWDKGPNKSTINLPKENTSSCAALHSLSESTEKKQSVVVLGFLGATFFDRERHALDLLQETCSDLGSRLFMRIRDELGLAYYVGAQHMPGILPGYFAFYAGTSPEQVDLVQKELKSEIETLKTEGITQKELDRSKAKMLGQRQIARQELGHLAMSSALDELYGLGYDHPMKEDEAIRAVTLQDVQEAAQKFFQEAHSCVAVVGP